MAKSKVKPKLTFATGSTGTTSVNMPFSQVVEPEPEEVYTGNVYEFQGGINVSNNSGPVTITVYMQGVPNNPPPTGGGSVGS